MSSVVIVVFQGGMEKIASAFGEEMLSAEEQLGSTRRRIETEISRKIINNLYRKLDAYSCCSQLLAI